MTLAIFVGVLLFAMPADAKPYPRSYSKAFTRSYSRKGKSNAKGKTVTWSKTEITSSSFQNTFAKNKNPWLDDYSKPVGFTYGADAIVQTTYLWRGLYAGGLNLQGSANVGYGGLYALMWWNIGTTDWKFDTFQPEVDLILGFSRWGLDISAVLIHSFQRGFFDFNYYSPGSGNALEVDLRYTVSSKLPLSILWATRFCNSDGFVYDGQPSLLVPKEAAVGDTLRAYSTYIELSYKHTFPYDISLRGAVGMSPWKSMYSGYKKNFVVPNIELTLRKDWSVSEHCGLKIQGTVSINPSALAADKSTAEWHPKAPGAQSINANIGFGVYLK